jgi:hypothetical protein
MSANEVLVQGSIAMTRGSILRVEDGRDLTLYVWEGAVWLTQEGEERDRWVGAGECFRLDRQGIAIAHATQRTVMTIAAPGPELYARRIVLAKAGSAVPVELYSAANAGAPVGALLRRFWSSFFSLSGRSNASSTAAS